MSCKPRYARLWGLLLLPCLSTCEAQTPRASAERAPLPPGVELASEAAEQYRTFSGYWQRGLAELNRFELTQSRYGQTHDGEAVWIFVTEPFDTEAQVKHEGQSEPDNVTQVLKLNAYRRFYTGVYPYTMMTSSFLPLDALHPLKLTFTSQEWCGQVFSQLNRRDGAYRLQSFSYFQDEGDVEREVKAAWTEDGLWSLLRRDPEALPTGTVSILPALHHLRLRHEPQRAEKAEASLSPAHDGRRTYSLQYAGGRRMAVHFSADFPYAIQGFEENPGKGLPVTRAKRTRSVMMAYWKHNGAHDGAYRKALGLTH